MTSNVFAVDEVMGCDGSAFVNTSGGMMPYSFLWDDPAGQTTPTASNLCAGKYTVLVDVGGGCNITGSVTIADPGGVAIVVDNTPTCNNVCDGQVSVMAPLGGSLQERGV